MKIIACKTEWFADSNPALPSHALVEGQVFDVSDATGEAICQAGYGEPCEDEVAVEGEPALLEDMPEAALLVTIPDVSDLDALQELYLSEDSREGDDRREDVIAALDLRIAEISAEILMGEYPKAADLCVAIAESSDPQMIMALHTLESADTGGNRKTVLAAIDARMTAFSDEE